MKIIKFETIDSTNKYLCSNYKELDNFTICVSDEQTSGRGRETRVWVSSKGENLTFSILLKDKELIKKYASLSLGSGYIIAKTLEEIGLKNVSIKWPNDVYVNEKKICGILLNGNINEYLVIGIGLNVNQKEFPTNLRHVPTSIYLESGKVINTSELLMTIISNFNHVNDDEFEEETLKYIRSHNYLLGKYVTINNIKGTCLDINQDFSIQIDDNKIFSGEIENF